MFSTSQLARPGWRFATRLIQLQCAFVVLTALLTGLFFKGESSISVMLGGLSIILPTLLFAALAFRFAGATAAQQTVRAFYLGEALKIVLSALAMGLLLVSQLFLPGFLFLGACLALLANWLAPICIKQQ